MQKLKLLLLLVTLFLAGCAGDFIFLPATDSRIQEWVEQEYYGNAIAALRARPQAKRDETLLKKLTLQAQQYDIRQAEKVRELAQSGNLREAFNHLHVALLHYPEGARLNQVQEQLNKQQKEFTGRLRAQLLLAKAQWLLQARKLLHNMRELDPSRDLAAEIEKTSWEISTTADELYQLGMMAMKQGDIDLAYNCLTLSDKLYPAGKTTTAIARLEQIQFAEKQKKIQEEKLAKEREAQKQQEQVHRQFLLLSKQLSDALARGDLGTAEKLLGQMKQLKEKPERIRELQAALNKAIKTQVDALMLRGNQLYKNGQIELARTTWLKALKLQPDNRQLKQNIARAEKVLKRLQELKSKEPGKAVKPPTP